MTHKPNTPGEPLADLLDDILYWIACFLLASYTLAVLAGLAGYLYTRWAA